uniref:Cationic amino acid transporter 4 n=1 Tax=Hemiscolopendra marginata TaxID=943146 RepID=A0A646QGA3_9MYRI
MTLKSVCDKLNRTKKLDSNLMETPLKRCLTTTDMCFLGIGHMVGSGIYVLTGEVAKNIAGPAIVLSYAVAGLASFLAAICYAEFGTRVPRAGSAYVYTYVTMGEVWAFIIGWNIILEHMIGAAASSRAWSGYLDSLLGGPIRNGTINLIGTIQVDFLSPYPDLLAACVCLFVCLLMVVGVKGSTVVSNVLTCVNLAVIAVVICFGFFWADGTNWTEANGGNGFLPFGLTGVIAGAATCFYAFVGFDSIATCGEEAKNPSRSIPFATLIAMSVVTIAYILVSAALTLMVPYYEIVPSAALPEAFALKGVSWVKYMVAVGSLVGMTTSLYGALFALPRCLYAMACDGLIFEIFTRINPTVQMPLITVAVCGIFTSIITAIFDIDKLVEFMSIGTLMAYTVVSVSVIILRYQPQYKINVMSPEAIDIMPSSSKHDPDDENNDGDPAGKLKPVFGFLESVLDCEPGFVVTTSVLMMTLFVSAFCGIVQLASEELSKAVWWAVLLVVIFLGCAVICFLLICLYQQNPQPLAFKVPFVPLIPTISIFINVFLMTHLKAMTWMRFIVWMLLGFLIYFGYGIRHSKENEPLAAYSALLLSMEASKEPWGSMKETIHCPQMKTPDMDEDKRPIVAEEEITQ